MCYTYSNYYRIHVQKETRHFQKVKLIGLGTVAHHGRQRQVDRYEYKASLVYIASSRPT